MDTIQKEHNFWLVGGDLRFRALARLLREDGHTVRLSALRGEGLKPEPLGQDLRLAHCVILPLPVTGPDGISLHTPLWDESVELGTLLDLLEPGQLVCGGKVLPEVRAEAVRRGLRLADYYEREECKVANAVPTAVAVGLTPLLHGTVCRHVFSTEERASKNRMNIAAIWDRVAVSWGAIWPFPMPWMILFMVIQHIGS